MKETYCFECGRKTTYHIREYVETLPFKDVIVTAGQKHAFCGDCGQEVFPEEVVDWNTDVAHDAYRTGLGRITVSEMNELLSKYNIGAKPLSQLLGWGENTIERQMKHTIPAKEMSDKLKSLMNPENMKELLLTNGDLISSVALNKAMEAAERACNALFTAETNDSHEIYVTITVSSQGAVKMPDLSYMPTEGLGNFVSPCYFRETPSEKMLAEFSNIA